MTDRTRFQRLEALFHELDSLAPEARQRRLDQLAQEDPGLTKELRLMFGSDGAVTRRERALDALQASARASLADSEVTEIGPYTLLEVVGEGGMGRVYKARQSEPVQRTVAIKLLRRGLVGGEAVARFEAERQALAVVDHPHIARVFDAGNTDDGRPWFAMEFIEGVPITTWAAERALSLDGRLRLLLPVCDAVAHAHRKGLIHRDLKPSNILVIDDAANGFPKVIDFGIARPFDPALSERTGITQLGELIGTPEYMSPEQASLGVVDVDTRSDVYSLGLVLYELLVGKLPTTGQRLRALGFEAMCREIREGDTPRPSRVEVFEASDDPVTARWRSRLRGDLDSVVLKALAKDREQRYGSISEFAEDLRRYLDNEPVMAQPPSLRYRAGKFARRHRWPVLAGGAIALGLIIGTVLAGLGLQQAREALRQSEASLAEARLLNDISNAYADALQRLFGGIGDVETSTTLLLEHVDARTADWQADPDNAALAAFAVGRHFLSRNDYPTARRVFEPWLQAGYGPEKLRRYGWQLLGFAYRYTGEPELALAAFRRVETMTTPEEIERPGTASRRVQIALLSGASEDFEQARALLMRLIDKEENTGASRMGLLNSLFQLESRAGDLDAAHAAIRGAVDIIDSTPGMEFAGQDTNRLNLAQIALYTRGDLDAVRTQLEAVRSGALGEKGESREAARALLIEGVALRLAGDPQAALARLQAADPLFQRFSGAANADRLLLAMEQVVTLLELKRLDEATERLADMRTWAQSDSDQRVAIAAAWIALARTGPEAASETLAAADIDLTAARTRDYSVHHLDRLKAAGVRMPAGGQAAETKPTT